MMKFSTNPVLLLNHYFYIQLNYPPTSSRNPAHNRRTSIAVSSLQSLFFWRCFECLRGLSACADLSDSRHRWWLLNAKSSYSTRGEYLWGSASHQKLFLERHVSSMHIWPLMGNRFNGVSVVYIVSNRFETVCWQQPKIEHFAGCLPCTPEKTHFPH